MNKIRMTLLRRALDILPIYMHIVAVKSHDIV